MNDLPRQQLRTLIANYGRSLCDDPQRCEALLKDFCHNQYQREIYVLVDALKERVAADLLASQNSVPREVLLLRLAKRLHDNLALTEDAALWAVESWALALGVSLPPVSPQYSQDNIIQKQATTTIREQPPTSIEVVSNPRGRTQPQPSATTQQNQFNVVGSSPAPSRPSLWKTLGILGIAVVSVLVLHHPQSKHSKPLSTTAPSPAENTPSPSISGTPQPLATATAPSPAENTPSPSISETPQPSENAEFFLNRGKDKFDRKDYTGAIADYKQAIQLNPHDSLAYNDRGCAYYGLGDYQAAIADYNQAIQLNPRDALVYYNRGLPHSDLGDYQAAIADYGTAANFYYRQGKMNDYNNAVIKLQHQVTLLTLHNKGRN